MEKIQVVKIIVFPTIEENFFYNQGTFFYVIGDQGDTHAQKWMLIFQGRGERGLRNL